MALVHSFTFYNAIQWAGLKSLSRQLWPLGLMFDTFELEGIPQKTKNPTFDWLFAVTCCCWGTPCANGTVGRADAACGLVCRDTRGRPVGGGLPLWPWYMAGAPCWYCTDDWPEREREREKGKMMRAKSSKFFINLSWAKISKNKKYN